MPRKTRPANMAVRRDTALTPQTEMAIATARWDRRLKDKPPRTPKSPSGDRASERNTATGDGANDPAYLIGMSRAPRAVSVLVGLILICTGSAGKAQGVAPASPHSAQGHLASTGIPFCSRCVTSAPPPPIEPQVLVANDEDLPGFATARSELAWTLSAATYVREFRQYSPVEAARQAVSLEHSGFREAATQFFTSPRRQAVSEAMV
jgi:hypothetical protein